MKKQKKELICICGHSHISYMGDLGKDNDEVGYARLDECENCNCQTFKKKKEVLK